MKKLAVLMVVAALGLLSACASRQDEGDIVLRLANWGGASEENDFERTVNDLYRQFERENPGIKIKIERIPGSQEYVNKMLLSFVAGTEPDIMALDASSAAVFINNGVLMDLKPLFKNDSEFNIEDYWPNVLGIAARGEKVFAIPGDFTPMVMYYNKRLFRESAVPFPKPGWTYGDFIATAEKLTKGDQFGFTFGNWMPGWIMWLWNDGGDVLDPSGTSAGGYVDGARSKRALEFIRDFVNVRKISPSLSSTAATGVDLFTNANAAMQISGHWAMVGYQSAPKDSKGLPKLVMEDVGIVELPSNLPQSVTVMYEVGFAIGKNCRHPEAAWKLVRFLTSRRFQSVYNSTGIAICARKDVAEERARTNALEAEFLRIVPSARAPWGSKVEGYDFVESTGQKMMDNILGDMPVEQAAREAAERIDRYFKIK